LRTKPVVVAVQGVCFAVGIELMLAADMVVAAEDTRFGQIEVRRGIFPNHGATLRIVERAGCGNAMRYLLTGDEFDAATALRLGLVQEVVPTGT
jgi:enoyl-CoA hydratase